MHLMLANQSTAAKRRVFFHLVDATDGITAETGEAGGQPQISTNGGAWTNTGIGVLVAIGNGRYYAELTQAAVATAGDIIETRYKSANTAECPGDSVQVVAFDPDDAVRLGLTAMPNAAANAAGGLLISASGGLNMDTIYTQVATSIPSTLSSHGSTLSAHTAALSLIGGDVAGLDGAAMRGTDGAYTGTPPTAAAIATAVLSTQMTEAYAANGVAPTLAQAQFAIHQMLMEFIISGTTWTVKKLDGSTTAFIVTLDDATSPTSASRD